MLSSESILKTVDWAEQSSDNFAKIEIHGDNTYVFVYKYSVANGVCLKVDSDCDDIDKAINDKIQKERKAEYEKLKAEFEGVENA